MRHKRMVNLSMVLTCLVLILCALFAVATYQSIRQLLYDEKASHVLNLTHSSVGELEAEMQKSIEKVEYLSQFVTYTIEQSDDIANEVRHYAGQFQQKFGYADIYITDADGNVLLNDRQPENISDRDYFIYGMKGNSFLSEPLYDRVTGRRVVVFGSPYYVDEQIHGIVIATKRLEDLYEPFNVQVFNGDGYAYVTNSYGDVIIASLHNESNKTASNIFEYINSDHNTTRKIQDIRNGMAAGITWSGEVNNGQEVCYICYAPINISHSSEDNWYMVSMVPLEKMMHNSNRILARAALLIAMVIAVILSAAAWHRYSYKKQQQHIKHLAYFDGLTGLHNVNYLRENYDRFLESSAKNNRRYAYTVFDIDKFKMLNETLGYHEGDAILKAVADVLRSHLADGEEAVRIANDQFGVLLYFEGKQQLEQRLLKWEQAFDDAVKQNVILLNRLRFSFGMYEIRSEHTALDKVMDYADFARKQVKMLINQNIGYYDDKVMQRLKKDQQIEQKMESALQNNEFVPYLQPKVDIASQKIVGAEALVRWIQPDGTFLPPSEFIPLFERNGFICKLDYSIFEAVCMLKRRLIDHGLPDLLVSVNMSRKHLHLPDFVAALCAIADKHRIPHDRLEIEVTENIYYEDLDQMSQVIVQLKQAGFTVSMDDFGAGYSSLNLLKELPIDVLKLDAQFLNERQMTAKGAEITRSVVHMAQHIHLDVICEGVETAEQVEFLKSIGCDKAQGFYYYPPLPEAEFLQIYLEQHAGGEAEDA